MKIIKAILPVLLLSMGISSPALALDTKKLILRVSSDITTAHLVKKEIQSGVLMLTGHDVLEPRKHFERFEINEDFYGIAKGTLRYEFDGRFCEISFEQQSHIDKLTVEPSGNCVVEIKQKAGSNWLGSYPGFIDVTLY